MQTSEREFSIVFNYLEGVDYAFEPAVQNDLNRRFAIVVGSYRSNAGCSFYDHSLVIQIIESIAGLFEYTDANIWYEVYSDKKWPLFNTNDISNFNCWLSAEDPQFEDEKEPFAGIDFFKDDLLICSINAEYYYGGPYPYHDCHVYSFYCKDFNADEIVTKLSDLAKAEDFCLSETIYGNETPSVLSYTLWARFKRWFFR